MLVVLLRSVRRRVMVALRWTIIGRPAITLITIALIAITLMVLGLCVAAFSPRLRRPEAIISVIIRPRRGLLGP